MIDQRVVLNEYVWDEVKYRRGPQSDLARMEADGIGF